MNKIWVILLFCSTSLSATEKTRMDLEWRAEPKNEKSNFSLKWREEKSVEKPVNEIKGDPPYALRQNQYTRPSSHRKHQLDGGNTREVLSDFHSEFHSHSDRNSDSLSIQW